VVKGGVSGGMLLDRCFAEALRTLCVRREPAQTRSLTLPVWRGGRSRTDSTRRSWATASGSGLVVAIDCPTL
jgi:hypothetical protein